MAWLPPRADQSPGSTGIYDAQFPIGKRVQRQFAEHKRTETERGAGTPPKLWVALVPAAVKGFPENRSRYTRHKTSAKPSFAFTTPHQTRRRATLFRTSPSSQATPPYIFVTRPKQMNALHHSLHCLYAERPPKRDFTPSALRTPIPPPSYAEPTPSPPLCAFWPLRAPAPLLRPFPPLYSPRLPAPFLLLLLTPTAYDDGPASGTGRPLIPKPKTSATKAHSLRQAILYDSLRDMAEMIYPLIEKPSPNRKPCQLSSEPGNPALSFLRARQCCIDPPNRLGAEIALALLLGQIIMDGSRFLSQAHLFCGSLLVTSNTNVAPPGPGSPALDPPPLGLS